MTPPARFGRYEILHRIGKSMTEVYLALDAMENRQVALKLVKADGDRVTQLVIEAERRGAAIQREIHALDPRMIEVYEFGDQDGYFFVAMQYVEGRNLAEVLGAEQAIDPIRAAAIGIEICEQLAKFHAGQPAVVHGDIKPSNIHLGPQDTVRLLDFGIAKTLRMGPDGQLDATLHQFGSPSYCSPERLARSEVDPQSDLWALGATLYEMLCGAPPYQAESTAKLESLIRSKRSPRALPPACPLALRAIVAKALAPRATQRYASAGAMQADLQAFLERKPTLAERERGWSPNVTLEAAREMLRRASRTVGRGGARLRARGAAVSFAAGMVLWVGGTIGWEALQARRVAAAPHLAAGPAAAARGPVATGGPVGALDLAGLYAAEAGRILDGYHSSQDNALEDFDWQKAELCLLGAREQGATGARLESELALSRGYAILERLAGGQYSAAAQAKWRSEARRQFEAAAQALPLSPDPHLALARLWVNESPERAVAEFREAEKLGAAPGRREILQQADAYRFRAQREAGAAPEAAWRDAQTARGLYQRIAGFDRADRHLKEVEAIRKPVKHRVTYASRRRRWH